MVSSSRRGVENEDGFSCYPNELLLTKPGKSAGERLAGYVQLSRNNAFWMFEPNLDGRAFVGNRAVPQEPMNAARLRILKGQIIEQCDHISQVSAHRCKHSQRKLRTFAQQGHKFSFWYNNHRARRQARARWQDSLRL